MSVRKRVLKTGRIRFVCDYKDNQGKRRHRTFGTKTEAETFSKRTNVELLDNLHVADGATISVLAAAYVWIKAGQTAGLERSTITQRLEHVELHIQPFFKLMRLTLVSIRTIRAFQTWLRANGRSEAMVRKVSTSLYGILAEALELQFIARHPMHGMRRAARSVTTRQRLEIGRDIPTMNEVAQLIAALNDAPEWRPVLLTMLFSGIRASEARGLRWSDLDLTNKVLHVKQRADRYQKIGPPKSRAGTRSVPIGSRLANTLKAWKLACPPSQLGLAFPGRFGHVLTHESLVNMGLKPAIIRAGLVTAEGKARYSGLHTLRHWHASWLINRVVDGGQELPVKQVQERLGHSNITMTLDTYAHLFPPIDDGRLDAAEDRLMLIRNES